MKKTVLTALVLIMPMLASADPITYPTVPPYLNNFLDNDAHGIADFRSTIEVTCGLNPVHGCNGWYRRYDKFQAVHGPQLAAKCNGNASKAQKCIEEFTNGSFPGVDPVHTYVMRLHFRSGCDLVVYDIVMAPQYIHHVYNDTYSWFWGGVDQIYHYCEDTCNQL